MTHNLFEITHTNFEADVLQAAVPVLVEFTADWCPPCKMIAPILAEIAGTYAGQLRIGTLDADLYPEYVQHFGVMGLPTLILFQHGEPVAKIIGYQPRTRIEAQITPFLNPANA